VCLLHVLPFVLPLREAIVVFCSFAVDPSLIPVGPKSTTPTLSSSRFKTIAQDHFQILLTLRIEH
jgi:hypothetical protein